jgi:putative membrane protein
MKKQSIIRAAALALGLGLAPVGAFAQATTANPSGSDQNSKAVPNAGDATSGSVNGPASDTANSKTPTAPLDQNPSSAPTGSDTSSATKDSGALSTDKKTESSTSDKMTDKSFLLKAAQGGMTEVELGKIAEQNGSSSDVKQFGSHMVMDHGKANDDLKALAQQKGVTVPSTLDAKHQAMVDHFKHLSGAAFDKAYVNAMVKAHMKDAEMFREESKSAQDPDVKNFASSTLTVVENHLSDIKSIQSKMK